MPRLILSLGSWQPLACSKHCALLGELHIGQPAPDGQVSHLVSSCVITYLYAAGILQKTEKSIRKQAHLDRENQTHPHNTLHDANFQQEIFLDYFSNWVFI